MNAWDKIVVWVGTHSETAAIALVVCAIGWAVSGSIVLFSWLGT